MALLETLQKSADLIKSSKCMLLLTSAGMSADSNIPTFRDKDGYWKNFPPFKEKNLEAQDLASPWAFRNVLPHAWAFYEWRRRNADENKLTKVIILSTTGLKGAKASSTQQIPMAFTCVRDATKKKYLRFTAQCGDYNV